MPIGGLSPDTGTPDDTAQAAAQLPFSQDLRTSEAFGHADFGATAAHIIGDVFSPQGPNAPVLPGASAWAPPSDPDTLNAKYGVPGVLRFNKPAYDYDAAWQQHMALEHQFRDTVFARTNPQPLTDFGASLAGGLLDPAALTTMVATGGFSDAAFGALGLKTAAEAAPAVTTLGRLANAARVPFEGAVSNLPFVGLNALAASAQGDDYDAGDALRDLAAGAILHTTAHMAFRSAPALFRRGGAALDPAAEANTGDAPPIGPGLEPNPAPGVPPEVDALDETARRGAFIHALDTVAGGQDVGTGGLIQRELGARADAAEGSAPTLEPASPLSEGGSDVFFHGSPVAALDGIDANAAGGTFGYGPVKSFSTDRAFAEGYAGDGGEVYAAKLYPQRVGDFRNPGDLADVLKYYEESTGPLSDLDRERIEHGAWPLWENPGMWKKLGWDGAFTREEPGRADAKHLNVSVAPHVRVDLEARNLPHEIAADANRRFASGDAGELETLRPPGRSEASQDGAGAVHAGPGGGDGGPPRGEGDGRSGLTFQTAKGSTYLVHEDGTTTRNKAERDTPGHEGDHGEKDRTARTVYVDSPERASRLSAAGIEDVGPKGARVIIRDGKASLLIWNEKEGKWGRSPSGTDVPISETPGLGKSPLELWKPADDVPGWEAYRGMHAGNPIVEMRPSSEPSGKTGQLSARPSAEAMIAADPELKALADDTARLSAEHGIEASPTPENQNPATLAEAFRAAAVCLIGEIG